ncbi:Ca2+-binding EF-hand superfamily protein [Rehaibacterium terrae]|uniref:Ca2+-binding EF-hand superfamily protein n=1 Tax=Rehaibacterium terrae TaxID=1341696 RepID=A0A7W7V7Q5_9GAMM|nr:Ca2+-binding EF-hand superfamily protein [Rehaibacterium terrae]
MRRLVVCLALALAPAAVGAQFAATPDDYLARMDVDGDGRISLAEYQAWMTRGFRAMDRNGDGILQDDELPPGVILRPSQPRTLDAFLANLARAFERLDRDGDGFLDAAELAAPPR